MGEVIMSFLSVVAYIGVPLAIYIAVLVWLAGPTDRWGK
jgi:hypothetical protein